jgi:hypothetical protein
VSPDEDPACAPASGATPMIGTAAAASLANMRLEMTGDSSDMA